MKKALVRPGNKYSLQFVSADNQRVEVPYSSDFDTVHNPSSVCLWFKILTTVGNRALIAQGDWHNGIWLSSANEFFFHVNDETNRLHYIRTIWTNRDANWHFIVAIWDGSDFSFYLDGQSLAIDMQRTVGNRGPFETLCIGSMLGGWHYEGNINFVKIYSRALSESEILLLYKGIKVSTKGLVGRWDFTEGSGIIAKDKSGFGNNGDLINNPSYVEDTVL